MEDIRKPYSAKHTRTYNTQTREIHHAVVVKWSGEGSHSSLVVDEQGNVLVFEREELAKEFANKLNDQFGFKKPNLPEEFFVRCNKRDKSKLINIFKVLDIEPDPDFENIWYGHNDGFYVQNLEFNLSSSDELDEDTPILTMKDLRSKINEKNG